MACPWKGVNYLPTCMIINHMLALNMPTPVIGVDIGGTYTDAVIICDKKVLSSCKHETTANLYLTY